MTDLMTDLMTTPAGKALLAFGATVLGVVFLALLSEAIRALRHQSAVRAELRRLTEKGIAPSAERGPSLLKADSSPMGVERAMARLPHSRDLQSMLEQARVGFGVGAFLLLTAGLGGVLTLGVYAITTGPLLPVLAGIVGATLPYGYVTRKRRKRLEAFETHFPEAIDLLARSIRAGHALTTGFRVVGEEASEPVAEEFRQVFEEQKFGLPWNESLFGLVDRVDMPDVRIFSTAVMIQRDVGGNLAEILDKLSEIIRERFKFRRQLRIHTAQGRMTGMVLGIAPLIAGLGMFLLNPEYMRPLVTEPLGQAMLISALGLQLLGYLSIRRITRVDF